MGKKNLLKEIESFISLRYRLYGRYDIKSYTRDVHERFLQLMREDKLYLDPKLNEEKLMTILGTNRFYLSRCIKLYEKCYFREFVNRMRVAHAQRLFMNDINMKVTQMCYDSGFNSMSTFYRAFVEEVGQSPTDWCEEYRIRFFHSLGR